MNWASFLTHLTNSAGIFNAHFLVTPKGPYKGYPFRSYNGSGFTGGFNDHFPAYVYLIREQR